MASPALVNAYDALDPTGNVTILWDIQKWTADGYVAQVTLHNYQMFRKVNPPGWGLNWTWTDGEIIWNMFGAGTTSQGNCSELAVPGGNLPYCCDRTPSVLDKSPASLGEWPSCCKDGVLTSLTQDLNNSISMFQLQVGNASNSINSVQAPANFTFLVDGYSCTDVIPTKATEVEDPTTLQRTRAIATWKVVCSYTAVEAKPIPKCCVSLSAFYNDTIIPCQTCACACGSFSKKATVCNATGGTTNPYLTSQGKQSVLKREPTARLCSPDGCPVSIHFHLKTNYKDYWRSKFTIINRDINNNWTDWNLAWEHPNFVNFTESFSWKVQQIQPFGVNNSAVFWGKVGYNKDIAVAGENGNVQSEFLFAKIPGFTLKGGWAYPRKVYFNGEECVMPQEFPQLPSSSIRLTSSLLLVSMATLVSIVFVFGL